jgi:hypothetical protein
LEGEKRNTHRQYYLIHIETRIARNHVANLGKNVDYLQLNAEQTVYHVYYEVRIFEVTQQQYVYDQSDYQPYLTAPFGTGYGYRFGTKIIEQYGKYQHQDKKARCLEIKKQPAKHQKCIAKQYFATEQSNP